MIFHSVSSWMQEAGSFLWREETNVIISTPLTFTLNTGVGEKSISRKWTGFLHQQFTTISHSGSLHLLWPFASPFCYYSVSGWWKVDQAIHILVLTCCRSWSLTDLFMMFYLYFVVTENFFGGVTWCLHCEGTHERCSMNGQRIISHSWNCFCDTLYTTAFWEGLTK